MTEDTKMALIAAITIVLLAVILATGIVINSYYEHRFPEPKVEVTK